MSRRRHKMERPAFATLRVCSQQRIGNGSFFSRLLRSLVKSPENDPTAAFERFRRANVKGSVGAAKTAKL